MKSNRWFRLAAVLVVSLGLVVTSSMDAVAATRGQASRAKGSDPNQGTYQVALAATTCSDGLTKQQGASYEFTADGPTVSMVNVAAKGAPPKTGDLSDDGSFTISSALAGGSQLTVTGTFKDGRVQGTWNIDFASGITCTTTFSGQRAGKKSTNLADEIVAEVGLDAAFERYDAICGEFFSCPTESELPATVYSSLFVSTFCPGEPPSCDVEGFSKYQRTLASLVHRTQLLATAANGEFPSVKAAAPIILQMAFHGATDEDPASARAAASAAWRLLALVAAIDLKASA